MTKRKFNPATVAAATNDAYSRGAFCAMLPDTAGDEWYCAAAMLADRGYTARQAEIILRSKLTRWCRDAYSAEGEGRAEYLSRFLDEQYRPLRGLGVPERGGRNDRNAPPAHHVPGGESPSRRR